MSELTRRRLLAVGGVTAAAAVAGCSSSSASEDENDPADGTVLGDVSVENLHADEHTIDVIVEFDEEIVHWSTHHLDANDSGADLEREWPSDPGDVRLTVRLDEDEVTHVTPARWNDPSCLNLTILLDRSGELTVLSDTSGGACSGDPASTAANGSADGD